MAILSNINGKFAVDSTGAIQLSGSAGTANYVLVSGGAAAAPTWVAGSTVIGGPYLPLSGGTLTGATATASGISFTSGGTISVNATTALTLSLNSTHANGGYMRMMEGGAAKLFIGTRGSVSGTSGTGYDIYTVAGNDLRFFTNGTNLALTIDTSQNATFAGNVTVSGTGANLFSGDLDVSGTKYLYLGGWVRINNPGSGTFKLGQYNGSSWTDTLNITNAGAATFTGKILLSQNGTSFEHGYSGNGLVLSHHNVGPSNAIVSGDGSNPDNLYINNGGAASDWSNVIITGNVGIGTVSPSTQLDVYHSTAPRMSLSFAGGSGNGGAIDFNLINGGVSQPITLQIKGIDDGAYRQHMTFSTKLAATGASALEERMRIDSAGNVGIGTDAPQYALSVNSATTQTYAHFTTTTTGTGGGDGTNVGVNGADFYIWQRENAGVIIGTNATTALTIDGSQNATFAGSVTTTSVITPTVTTATNTSLFLKPNGSGHVYLGDSGNGTNFYHYSAANDGIYATYDFSGGYYRIATTAGGIKIDDPFYVSGNATFAGNIILNPGNSNKIILTPDTTSHYITANSYWIDVIGNQHEVFRVFGGVGGTTEFMRIDGSGNVGINTNSPSHKLHVVGDQLIFGDLLLEGSANSFRTVSMNTSDGSDNQTLSLCGGATASSARGGRVEIKGNEADGSVVLVAGNVSTGDIDFYTANSQRMIINNAGNVGIGVTTPTNQLHVHTDDDDAYAIRIEGSTNNGAGIWTGLGIGGESTNSKTALLFQDIGVSYARGKLHLCVNNETNQNIATPSDAKLTIANTGYTKITDDGDTTWDGYSFHTITQSAASQPTVMIYNDNAGGNNYGINVIHRSTSANTTGRFFLGATNNGGTENIKIYTNGNIQNTNNSYTQLSDSRLKENIVDATSKLEEIKRLRVVNWNFIGDDLKQIGMVAQEVEEIFPGLVDVTGDNQIIHGTTYENVKSLKYSVLVPILVKAIQELEARVTELENN